MPYYDFKCSTGHVNERRFSLEDNVREINCPNCGLTAQRCISAPAYRGLDPRRTALVDATERTAYEPGVVDSLPRSGNRKPTPVSRNPLHATLPKP